jgi:hypothetical protein
MRTGVFLLLVAAVGAVLGIAIAGLPERTPDRPAIVSLLPPVSMVADTTDTTDTAAPTSTSSTTSTSTTTSTTVVADTTPPTGPSPGPSIEPPAPAADRADVRLVLANGDGRFDLVGSNAARLLRVGYVTIDQTDVNVRPPVTIIYFRPGFDREAAVLAGDLQTPNASIEPLPPSPVTGNDDRGDLVVVLGPDALR